MADETTSFMAMKGAGYYSRATIGAKHVMDNAAGLVLDALARLSHPVLVDCTAAEGMEHLYEEALSRGIHVVVANKKFHAYH